MTNPITLFQQTDTTSNPAPLGLLGFGMTTILLNIHNAGFYELNSMIIGMGIFYGGMAQIIAGIMEWKKNNTFGTTAFCSYGLFWLTLCALWLLPKMGQSVSVFATQPNAVGWYMFMWGLFTFFMFIGTLKLNRALQFVFLSLTILFWLLATHFWTGNKAILVLAGWEGIICGFSAVYTAIAQIWNEVYGRVVLPVGPVKK
jgi:succinate-acetate transporter protein